MDSNQKIAYYRRRIESVLAENLALNANSPNRLIDAMRYAVFGNGKRLRPLLVYATAETFGLSSEHVDNVACAIELIHCYSLVHDDLPAMDNDDFRRGKKACHKAFDESTAILVGDSLQSLAFECMAKSSSAINSKQRLMLVAELAKASGYNGMAGGQALDLESFSQSLTIEQLDAIHLMKTGALLIAAVRLGALSATVYEEERLSLLTNYARYIGLAFQIQDDIFDYNDPSISPHTANYPSLIGIERAKSLVGDLFAKAFSMLESLSISNSILANLTELIKQRHY